MKLTESYLRNLIKQVINEVGIEDVPMKPMSRFNGQPVDQELLSSLKKQGYEVIKIDNGSYEIKHPTDSFKSYILEPKPAM